MAGAKLRSPVELFARDDHILIEYKHKKRVGDYLLGPCIGKGSFATVYEAMHAPTGEKVAVKVVSKQRCLTDEYTRRNLRREGSLLQKLRHSHLIQLYEVLETKRTYYLVMELCTGDSMLQRIERTGRIDEPTARRYLRQIVTAVRYLHENGIIHRDLKVENLLLSEEDNVKIIDFGLSTQLVRPNLEQKRSVSASRNQLSAFGFAASEQTKKSHSAERCIKTASRQEAPAGGTKSKLTKVFFEDLCLTQCGSPAYAAPEVLSRKPYGRQADVWSIGVNLYAMLVGTLPFTVQPFSLTGLLSKMLRQEINTFPRDLSNDAIDIIRGLLTPDPDKRLRLTQVLTHPWLQRSEQAKESVSQANKLTFISTPAAKLTREGGRTHTVERTGCSRIVTLAKSQSPCGSRSPHSLDAKNETMCKASFRNPSLTYRRPMIPSKTRPCEDQHFSESDFEAHENCLTSLIIAYICSGALGSRELPHSGGHLHEARPPEHPGEKDLKDIVHDVGNNVPGQTTAAYNLLKQKVRRYCRENNVKFSYWLTVNDVGDTRPSEAHTTPTKEILKHWTTDEVLRSQAKNSAPTTGDLTSDIYPVFTIPQCLSVIDQRTRMQIGKEGGKANELSSEVESSLRSVPPLGENGVLDEPSIEARSDKSATKIHILTSEQRLLQERRALSRAKLCSQTIFSVDGDRIGDCSGNNIDCVTKLGNLKETSQYSSSSRSGHKSRIDADGPCMETPPRTGILELPHKEGTADPTMDRKIKSILRKTGQTLFGVSTPLPFLSGTERFGFEPERQREQLTVPCRSASRGNTPPVLGGDRWTVTASPKELPKCQSPGHQARPNTGGIPETLKRSRASISANRRVITTTTTQKTLAPPPPHPPRPSLVLPLRSPRNPSTTGQTYVLIHNRTSHYQKQRNISPVLLTPTSARRRISTSPVACYGGQTRAKTHSPAWQDLRPNHLHQRPLTVRTTCGSGKKGQQHQQQTLPLFRPLYASVFEC